MKTYAQLRADVIDKAQKEEDFRSRLLDDPKAAVEEAIGLPMPDSVSIEVHEESPTVAHLVLPPSGALTNMDLEGIAAGDVQRNMYGEVTKHYHQETGYFHDG